MKNILLTCITCVVLALNVGVNVKANAFNVYAERGLENALVGVNSCDTTAELSGKLTAKGKGLSLVEVTIVDVSEGSPHQPIAKIYTNTFGWYRVQLPNCDNDYEIIPYHRKFYFHPAKVGDLIEARRVDFEGEEQE